MTEKDKQEGAESADEALDSAMVKLGSFGFNLKSVKRLSGAYKVTIEHRHFDDKLTISESSLQKALDWLTYVAKAHHAYALITNRASPGDWANQQEVASRADDAHYYMQSYTTEPNTRLLSWPDEMQRLSGKAAGGLLKKQLMTGAPIVIREDDYPRIK